MFELPYSYNYYSYENTYIVLKPKTIVNVFNLKLLQNILSFFYFSLLHVMKTNAIYSLEISKSKLFIDLKNTLL